jgi:hypothetical protein
MKPQTVAILCGLPVWATLRNNAVTFDVGMYWIWNRAEPWWWSPNSFRLEHPSLVLSIDWQTTENGKVATRVHGFLQLPADSPELACGW